MHQDYQIYVEMEHVIRGNDALFKCKIPSYVADLAVVVGWVDSEGGVHSSGLNVQGKWENRARGF